MDKTKYIYLEAIVSILVNIALFALKLWAGIVSGSVALTADAWHTLSDSVSSMAVMAGAKLSAQAPDKSHPYGHGRWEYITAFIIAIFLVIIAFEFAKDSVINFLDTNSAEFGTLAIVVTIISILSKELLAQYAFYIARKTGDSTVRADGWHHRSDALSSVLVLAGIMLQDVAWWIDSALGLVVAFILFRTAYVIFKEAISKLLGEDLDNEQEEALKLFVNEKSKMELGAHHFHLHNYGRHQELTFHVKLDPNMTIAQGYELSTKLEGAIFKEYGYATTIRTERR